MIYFKFSFVKVKGLCLTSFFSLFCMYMAFFFPASFGQKMILAPLGLPLSFVQHQLAFVLVHFVSWQQITTDWAMYLESSQFYRLEQRDGWADIGKTFILVNVCVALTKEFIPFIFLSAKKSAHVATR